MLYIVTPLSRPENLELIYNSLDLTKKDNFTWVIILDNSLSSFIKKEVFLFSSNKQCYTDVSKFSNSFVGHSHRNYFLDDLYGSFDGIKSMFFPNETDWVCFLDDDTILHPNFLEELLPKLDNTKHAIIFNQENKDGNLRLAADINNVKVCHIDMGQYVINLGLLPDDLRFKEDDYCADGIFIEELFKRVGPEQFLVINKTLSIYNKLR